MNPAVNGIYRSRGLRPGKQSSVRSKYGLYLRPQQDSNLRTRLRRPRSYGAMTCIDVPYGHCLGAHAGRRDPRTPHGCGRRPAASCTAPPRRRPRGPMLPRPPIPRCCLPVGWPAPAMPKIMLWEAVLGLSELAVRGCCRLAVGELLPVRRGLLVLAGAVARRGVAGQVVRSRAGLGRPGASARRCRSSARSVSLRAERNCRLPRLGGMAG
jgi:hypothetical protein